MAIVASIKSLVNLAFSLPAEKSWSKKKKKKTSRYFSSKDEFIWDHQRIAIQVKPHESPLRAREEYFCTGKKGSWEDYGKQSPRLKLAESLPGKKKIFLIWVFWFWLSSQGMRDPPSHLPTIFNWRFYSLILLHFPIVIKIFYKTITDQKSDFLFPVSFCSSE